MKNKVILVLWSLLLIAVTFITTTQIHISEIDSLKHEIAYRDSMWCIYIDIYPLQRDAIDACYEHDYIKVAENYLKYKDQYEGDVEDYKEYVKEKKRVDELAAKGIKYKKKNMFDTPPPDHWWWVVVLDYSNAD